MWRVSVGAAPLIFPKCPTRSAWREPQLSNLAAVKGEYRNATGGKYDVLTLTAESAKSRRAIGQKKIPSQRSGQRCYEGGEVLFVDPIRSLDGMATLRPGLIRHAMTGASCLSIHVMPVAARFLWQRVPHPQSNA
jgi:hypothetical protein